MAKTIDIPSVDAQTNYNLGSDQPGTHAFIEYGGSLYAYKGGNLYKMEPEAGSDFHDNGIPKTANVYENEPFPIEDILKRDDIPDNFKVALMRVRELADDGLLAVLEREKIKLEPTKQEPTPAPAPEEPAASPTARSFSIDKDGNIDVTGMSPTELDALKERMKEPNFDTIIQDAKDACKHSGQHSVNVEISPGNADTDYGPGPVGVITIPPSVSISSPDGETLISYPTGLGHNFDHYVTPDWMNPDLPRMAPPPNLQDIIIDFTDLPTLKTDTSALDGTSNALLDRITEIDDSKDYLRDLDPEQVKAIQNMLGVEADGKWGQKTMHAYQQHVQDNDIAPETSFEQLYADIQADNWKEKANHYATAAAKLPPETLNAPFESAKGELYTEASPERNIGIGTPAQTSTQTYTPA